MAYNKLFSARFWTILLVTVTYCFIVSFTAIVYVTRVTPEKLEGFAMGLIMGFAGFAVKALIEYFNRDRVPVAQDKPTTQGVNNA